MSHEQIKNLPQVVGGIIAIMAIAAIFSRYELRIGLDVGSPSLVADARHVTTDLLASAVILFGIIGTYLGYPIDRYVALLVAVIVARIGVQILVEAVKVSFRRYPGFSHLKRHKKNRRKPTGSRGNTQHWRPKFREVQICGNITYYKLKASQ